MGVKNPLLGETFGYLKILRRDYGHKRQKFLCKCFCGKEKIIRKDHLISGKIKSCGCKQSELSTKTKRKRYSKSKLLKPDNYGAKKALYTRYLWQIKNKIPENNATLDEFIKVAQGNCVYCGKGPDKYARNSNSQSKFLYTGVDRKDSNKGYNHDNIVSCCTECNRVKNNVLSYEEMKVAMNAVLNYRKKNND